MVNQGAGSLVEQRVRPEPRRRNPNYMETSVRHVAFFFLLSGASIMMSTVGDSSVNREHTFVGFLLCLLGLLLSVLHAFLLGGSPTAMTVARKVVAVFRKLFLGDV